MKKNYFGEFMWVIGFILFFILIKTSIISFYFIPTPSMLPNVIPGDRVMLNKLAYGLWLPFSKSAIFTWSVPKRGDMVFFDSPNGQGTFVKRVMGVPGDVISFHKGVIHINGQEVFQNTLSDNSSIGVQGIIIREKNKDLHLFSHLIMMSPEPGNTYFETRRFIVPPHKVFVLGDNRDSSVDSRVFGFVDEAALYGKAMFVLFSTTGNKDLFPEFYTNRFFREVE